jgi:hypothetical protein
MRKITFWIVATLAVVSFLVSYQISLDNTTQPQGPGGGEHSMTNRQSGIIPNHNGS